jgi:hypothetical protein
MACSSTFSCSTVFTWWTSQRLCIRLVTVQAHNVRFVVHTAAFLCVRVLWDMTPCRWVSDSRHTLRREALAQWQSSSQSTRIFRYMCPFRSQRSEACRDDGCDFRCKYSAIAKCTGTKRLNTQCGIDCSTAVECNATLVGKREGESAKRTGKFHLVHNLSGSSVSLLSEQASWTCT